MPSSDPSHVSEAATLTRTSVPAKIALYLEKPEPQFGTREDDTLGLAVSDPDTGAAFHYVPGCAAVDAPLAARLLGARLVFFAGLVLLGLAFALAWCAEMIRDYLVAQWRIVAAQRPA